MNKAASGSSPEYPKYRYIILTVFMLISLAMQIQWLSHAAVVRPAEVFYAGQFDPSSFFNIDFLAMVYMLVFILMSFPASYLIDTYGIKFGLRLASVMLAAFSLLKAIFAHNFVIVVVAQTGLAIAQPLILNAITALTVRWFRLHERALAAGLSTLAQYLGILLAMLLAPVLVGSNPNLPGYGTGFEKMLWIYAAISAVSALLCIFLIKERPEGATMEDTDRFDFFKGLRHILRLRDMRLLIILFLIGLGIFNAVSSMTDSIAEQIGVQDSDGLIGGLMLIGGIIGAFIIPALSDKFRKRKIFIVICMIGMVPGIAGLAFPGFITDNAESMYTAALIASFLLGFFVMSAGPIGFQYAAEISYPAPESTSQGILLWIGQISGMIFVAGMSIKDNQYLHTFMILFAALTIITLIISMLLRESKIILNA
ncbi:MFS transporter [Bacteroidota bacterium]